MSKWLQQAEKLCEINEYLTAAAIGEMLNFSGDTVRSFIQFVQNGGAKHKVLKRKHQGRTWEYLFLRKKSNPPLTEVFPTKVKPSGFGEIKKTIKVVGL